jgi:hypothetical protein
MGTLHEHLCPFMMSCSLLLRMRNVPDKSCRENENTFYVQLLFPKNLIVYEIMWKNMVEPERPQMTIQCMRISCWVPKSTNTPRICNIVAFLQQKWLSKSILAPQCCVIRTLPVIYHTVNVEHKCIWLCII